MEHTRAICYFIAGSTRSSKDPFPNIHEFWPLSTDGDPTIIDSREETRLRQKLEYAREHAAKHKPKSKVN